MQTIKTGVVVALLLAVCYGAFVALNAPDPELPDSFDEWASGEEELEQLLGMDPAGGITSMDSAVSVSPEQLIAGFPDAGTPLPGGTTEVSGLPDSSGNSLRQGSFGSENKAAGSSEALPGSSPKSSSVPLPGSNSASQLGLPAFPGASPPESTTSNSPPAHGSTELSIPGLEGLPKLERFPALENPSLENLSTGTGAISGPSRSADASALISGSASPANSSPASLRREVGQQPEGGTAQQERVGSPRGNTAPSQDFNTAREQALTLAGQGKLKEALALLTPYFNSPELGYEETNDLVDILDALSREVIYSQRHLLEPAHVVKATDTVASVAKEYNITPELLNALNGLGDSKALLPGSQLKVLRGPVNAQVSLSKQELTLFVGDLYAGRFPISIGHDPSPKEGSFEVVDRQTDRTYYASGGNVIAATDPRNPYGGYWLNLGDDLCIHGTASMASTDLKDAGCISLAPIDAKHVFSILVVGSEVHIIP